MFKNNITIDLDKGTGITEAIQELKDIAEFIESKMQEVAERLADVGIRVANDSASDEYSGYLIFTKEVIDSRQGECTVCMYADNVGEMRTEWETKNGTRSEVVNAVMMNEVGSGWFATNPDNLSDAGQGTFPNQKHAFDPRGWYWVDSTGKHHSYGEKGNLSMHKAYIAMRQEIERVVSEVFG